MKRFFQIIVIIIGCLITNIGFGQSVIGQLAKLATEKSSQSSKKDMVKLNENSLLLSTSFFGDEMPIENLQTLVNIETNQDIADVFLTKKFIDQKLTTDSLKMNPFLLKFNNESQLKCSELATRLKANLDQRNKFNKQVTNAHQILMVWKSKNQIVLNKAEQEGMNTYSNELATCFSNRILVADKLQTVFDKKAKLMLKKKISTDSLQIKISALKTTFSDENLMVLKKSMNNLVNFVSEAIPSLENNLTNSLNVVNDILSNLKTQKYFQTQKQDILSLLDDSKMVAFNGVLTKWETKNLAVMGLVAVSDKQDYNGTAWFESLQKLLSAEQIKGGMLDTANYIQNHIDSAYTKLSDCDKQ